MFGRQRQRLVAAVAVQRLRPAQYRSERLQGDADDIVVRLLRRQRAAGGLGVEPQLLRAEIRGVEPIAHDSRPETPRRAKLRDFLEKIVVRIEEEGQPLTDLVDVESGSDRRLDIGDRIRERERHLLDRGRARFPNVVAADGNRIPVRNLELAAARVRRTRKCR